jgi:hypothetical protein
MFVFHYLNYSSIYLVDTHEMAKVIAVSLIIEFSFVM